MPLDFPNTPAVNDTWTASNGVTYVWNGTAWTVSGSSVGLYLPLTGGTMTGPIALAADPTTDPQAANKHYVDQSINLAGNYLGTWAVASNTPNISAGGSISNANYVATTVNPATPETVPAGVPGIAGMTVANGDRIIWAAGPNVWQVLRSGGLTLAAADARYYAITNPSGYQTAANVTTALAPYAPLASPALTGNPTAPTPTPGDNDTSIATTAFVAAAVAGATAGVSSFNTRTGAVTLSSGDVTTALTFTPYNATNPAGYQTATDLTTALVPYATLAAPVFTGDARAVTPTAGDNDTSIATTAFVQTAASTGVNSIGRNQLHNSMFTVVQRGFGPWTANGNHTADRWKLAITSDTASVTVDPLNDTDRSLIGDHSARYQLTCAFTGNAAAGSSTTISQSLENVGRLGNKSVVVSFWAKASAGSPKLGVNVSQYFGTGGSPSATVVVNGKSSTITTGYTRYSQTFTFPSLASKVFGTNGDHCSIVTIWYSAGTSNATASGTVGVQSGTIGIWGVQLEVAGAATALDKPDPQIDMANCQRFYQAAQGSWGGYLAAGANTGYVPLPLMQTMRATPTVVITPSGGTNYTAVALQTANSNTVTLSVSATALGLTNFNYTMTMSADL